MCGAGVLYMCKESLAIRHVHGSRRDADGDRANCDTVSQSRVDPCWHGTHPDNSFNGVKYWDPVGLA